MEIYRIETLEFRNDKKPEELTKLIEMTQDLKVVKWESLKEYVGFTFVVKRKVEFYPDTIK
jgi:hypothetical protein